MTMLREQSLKLRSFFQRPMVPILLEILLLRVSLLKELNGKSMSFKSIFTIQMWISHLRLCYYHLEVKVNLLSMFPSHIFRHFITLATTSAITSLSFSSSNNTHNKLIILPLQTIELVSQTVSMIGHL